MAYIFITRKGKTNWKYILIIVILTLIVIGETLYLLKQEEKIPEIKLPEKVVKDETLNWKTYQSSKAEFSIKCPPDLECILGITPTPDDPYGRDVIISNFFKKSPEFGERDLIFISIESWTGFGPDEKITNFQDWVNYEVETFKSVHDPQLKQEDLVLDNIPAIKLSFVSEPYEGRIGRIICTQKGKRIYQIEAWIDPEYQTAYLPVFNQMLSTFRFLK